MSVADSAPGPRQRVAPGCALLQARLCWLSLSVLFSALKPAAAPTPRCREIKSVVEGPPQQLIETVAERVAERILEAHPLVRAVRVGVHKPHVAVSGVVESLGIEISREREPPA